MYHISVVLIRKTRLLVGRNHWRARQRTVNGDGRIVTSCRIRMVEHICVWTVRLYSACRPPRHFFFYRPCGSSTFASYIIMLSIATGTWVCKWAVSGTHPAVWYWSMLMMMMACHFVSRGHGCRLVSTLGVSGGDVRIPSPVLIVGGLDTIQYRSF